MQPARARLRAGSHGPRGGDGQRRPPEADRDFHFVMAAAAYHLAHLSARAYSLLAIVRGRRRTSPPIERTLAQLMRRDFGALRTSVLDYRASGQGSDARIAAGIQARLGSGRGRRRPARCGNDFPLRRARYALTDAFMASMSTLPARPRTGRAAACRAGRRNGSASSLRDLQRDEHAAAMVGASRRDLHLLSDLWGSSPSTRGSRHAARRWIGGRLGPPARVVHRTRCNVERKRRSTSGRRRRRRRPAPSTSPTTWWCRCQRAPAKLASQNFAFSAASPAGKRVVFITPLRALSAQTETILQRTFGRSARPSRPSMAVLASAASTRTRSASET